MKTNQIKCQPLVAAKPQQQQRRPIITFGHCECRQLSDRRTLAIVNKCA